MAGSGLLLLLRAGDWAARAHAVTLALTAAALGDRVVVALFDEALRSWVEGRFDEGATPAGRQAGMGSLSALVDEGRRDLGLEVVACDTAIRLGGIDPGEARRRLDGVRSLPELWRGAAGGRILAL